MKPATNDASWMEVIHLQSDENSIKELMHRLPEHISTMKPLPHLVDFSIMVNPQIASSMVLSFYWSKQRPLNYTEEGLLLAEFLNGWGMVYHSYWDIAFNLTQNHGETRPLSL